MLTDLILVDTRSRGPEHILFNGSLIKLLGQHRSLLLISDRQHAVELENYISDIDHHDFDVPQAKPGWQGALQQIKIFFKFTRLQKRFSSRSPVMFLSVSPLFLLLRFIFAYRNKDTFVLHSELEHITKSTLQGFVLRVVFFLLRVASNKRLLVLADHIKPNLQSIGYDHYRIESLPHPYHCVFDYFGGSEEAHSPPTPPLVVGMTGYIRAKSKGLSRFLRLVNLANGAVNFTLIGRFESGLQLPEVQGLSCPFKDAVTAVPQANFDSECSKLDLLVFTYESNAYEFTSSGAILDSLKFSTPILALPNPLFDYLEENSLFPGKIFRTEFELVQYIENYSREDADALQKRINCFRGYSQNTDLKKLLGWWA